MYYDEYIRVVILNYNTAKYTINLISNLQQQGYTGFEIVVVDNCSNASDYLFLVNSLPNSVHLVRSPMNGGYSAGNNLGFKYDSGKSIDYFLVLNSDLMIDDIHLIKKLVDGFKQKSYKPIYATSPLVNTTYSRLPSHSQIQVRKLLNRFQLFFLSFSVFKKLFSSVFNNYVYFSEIPFSNKYLFCDTINGAAFMISRPFLESNSYLDEHVFLYHEELILGKQIQNAGGVCLLNGHAEVAHLQGISTKSTPNQFNWGMERQKYLSEAYFFAEYLQMNKLIIKIFCILKEMELYLKKLILHRI